MKGRIRVFHRHNMDNLLLRDRRLPATIICIYCTLPITDQAFGLADHIIHIAMYLSVHHSHNFDTYT